MALRDRWVPQSDGRPTRLVRLTCPSDETGTFQILHDVTDGETEVGLNVGRPTLSMTSDKLQDIRSPSKRSGGDSLSDHVGTSTAFIGSMSCPCPTTLLCDSGRISRSHRPIEELCALVLQLCNPPSFSSHSKLLVGLRVTGLFDLFQEEDHGYLQFLCKRVHPGRTICQRTLLPCALREVTKPTFVQRQRCLTDITDGTCVWILETIHVSNDLVHNSNRSQWH